jgi:hypothetical protein
MKNDFKEITVKNNDKIGVCHFKIFDFNQMINHPAIVIIGRLGGKFVGDILSHYAKDISTGTGIVIAPTDKMSGFYDNYISNKYIHYEYKSEIIKNLLDKQTNIIKKEKENKDINTKAFIVMDNCLSLKEKWTKDQTVTELLMNGRHYHITYILKMTFPLNIEPELRCNFDYVFLFANDNIRDQKNLYERYAGIFPNFESFRQIFTQLTEDYCCMVIVNCDANADFFDKVFYYKPSYIK